jgi:hypothetical protein
VTLADDERTATRIARRPLAEAGTFVPILVGIALAT